MTLARVAFAIAAVSVNLCGWGCGGNVSGVAPLDDGSPGDAPPAMDASSHDGGDATALDVDLPDTVQTEAGRAEGGSDAAVDSVSDAPADAPRCPSPKMSSSVRSIE